MKCDYVCCPSCDREMPAEAEYVLRSDKRWAEFAKYHHSDCEYIASQENDKED